jgi:hypothetical protein
MTPWQKLFAKIRTRVLTHLETPARHYRQRIFNNMDRFYQCIRPGDVLLVEGRSKISRIIGLFSKSHWTHVALYVGDRLIQKDVPDRNRYRQHYGGEASRMIVEAFSGLGVIAAPAVKYHDHNIRICRPYGISPGDRRRVVDDVSAQLGKHYDDQNILDIALMLLPSPVNPVKRKGNQTCLGACTDFEVICSGMIARSFQRVGYPIVPAFAPTGHRGPAHSESPYGARLIMRHFSQILPRDFDLSPNFEVIKFNIIGAGPFDYKSLWALRHRP